MKQRKNMAIFNFRERFLVEGIMPERALLRLQRAGICIYNAKKVQKNQILFTVSRKDSEKVFAIYPNMWYNINAYAPFKVTKVGAVGLAKCAEMAKNRVGLWLGGLLFLSILTFADGFVFGVEFVGSPVYQREIYIALEAGGIKPFGRYKTGNEDVICSKILALDGVEYCSVQKHGLWARVELRYDPFVYYTADKESMQAKHTGILQSLTVLKGTAVKKIGDEICQGDVLAENAFYLEDGGQVRVEVIAMARIACIFQQEIQAATAEEAFALAYLQLDLSDKDKIVSKEIVGENGLYTVKIGYIVIETINL